MYNPVISIEVSIRTGGAPVLITQEWSLFARGHIDDMIIRDPFINKFYWDYNMDK